MDSLLKQLADAQATIAALQARVQELEAIKIPDDAFTYCAYCGEKSPVDEHNEDLSAHIKVCPKHPMRDVESQLTQRTAELEAAKRERDVWYARYNELSGVKDRQLNDLQAELERVRAERDHAKKMEVVQKEVADNQTWHAQKLRTLIAANKETKHDAI